LRDLPIMCPEEMAFTIKNTFIDITEPVVQPAGRPSSVPPCVRLCSGRCLHLKQKLEEENAQQDSIFARLHPHLPRMNCRLRQTHRKARRMFPQNQARTKRSCALTMIHQCSTHTSVPLHARGLHPWSAHGTVRITS